MSIPYIKDISEKAASVLNSNDYMVGYRCLNTLGRFIKIQKIRTFFLIITMSYTKYAAKTAMHHM